MKRRQWEALLPFVALFFFTLGAVSAISLLLWVGIDPRTVTNVTRQASWLLLLPLLLFMVRGWLINCWAQGYRLAAERFAEEMQLRGA